jgi:hypothetical protein
MDSPLKRIYLIYKFVDGEKSRVLGFATSIKEAMNLCLGTNQMYFEPLNRCKEVKRDGK